MNQETSHDFHFYVTSGAVVHKNYPFTPQDQYAYSPNCSLCISYGADKENLFNNPGLL